MTPLSPAFESLDAARRCIEYARGAGRRVTGARFAAAVEAARHFERAIACVALAVEGALAPPDPTAARVKVLEEENARLRKALEAYEGASQ